MNLPFKVIIPARLDSTRLPGKLLLDIAGKPLIQYVYESACASRAELVIIATDNERIRQVAESFGAEVVMTAAGHKSGTDRIAEAVTKMNEADESIIVNVQGDEYGLPSIIVDQLAGEIHNNPAKPMATLCEKITNKADLLNPHVVKVVLDKDNSAVYFSRSLIPWYEKSETMPINKFPYQPYRHIGIYAYRAGFLKTFTTLPHSPLEDSERLEQLRAIHHGYKIHVEEACAKCGLEVNTREDLERVRRKATSN